MDPEGPPSKRGSYEFESHTAKFVNFSLDTIHNNFG